MTLIQLYLAIHKLLDNGTDPDTLVFTPDFFVAGEPAVRVAEANEFNPDWDMPEGYTFIHFLDMS